MSAKPVKPTSQYVMDDGVPMAPDPTVRPAAPAPARLAREFTPAIAAELKTALGQSGLPLKLYKITFDNEVYVIRPLMNRDWVEVQRFIQSNGAVRQDQVDKRVVELGLVWPREITHPLSWEIQRAGLQKALADNIMARSGFIVPDIDQTDFLKVEPLTTMESGPRPTPEVIERLKTQTDWPLKLVFLDGQYYIIRPISRAEWSGLAKLGDDPEVDVETVKKSCVWSQEFPEKADFTERLPGTAATLSALTMQFSGFNSSPQVEEL